MKSSHADAEDELSSGFRVALTQATMRLRFRQMHSAFGVEPRKTAALLPQALRASLVLFVTRLFLSVSSPLS
jgi:hypothetical protein